MTKGKSAYSWSFQIIKSFLDLGVEKFCLAPGGRPTALINALDHFSITPSVHFDERGLGFYALGYGKKAGKPAVIITTSGTAVGNLLPAVMEASHSREPLIVLSTDLSWENSDSGANQSCKQLDIFSNFTNYCFDFPAVKGEFDANALHSNLRQAVFKSLTGPVHLNFRFKPPFIDNSSLNNSQSKNEDSEDSEVEKVYPAKFYPNEKEISDFCSELHQYKSGVVVIGQLPTYIDKKEVIDFLEHLKWPVFADVLSGLRGKFFNKFPIYLANEEIQKKLKPDCVLFLGGDILLRLPKAPFLRGVHKYLNQEYVKRILVSDNPNRQDPFLNYDQRIFSSLDVFCRKVKKKLLATKKSSVYNDFESLENQAREVSSVFSEFSCLSYLVGQLSNEKLFIGNSLAIRQLDCFLDRDLEVISAHGLKGIDGNLAMAAGFGANVVVLGDTSFLHDLNSLSLFREIKSIIIVLNNNGGNVFNYVEASNTKNFESNYLNPHSMSFKNSVAQFDLEYSKAIDLEGFKQAYSRANSSLKTSVIEVQSSAENLQENLLNYFR